ncbi:unnamed protein product [Gadus morhua 'NCC']
MCMCKLSVHPVPPTAHGAGGGVLDVAVEHFLRDIERRGKRLHCAVIGCGEERPHGDMNLLYRKSRLDWRQREQQEGSSKKSAAQNDPSATVGKGRDLASFRRHFRMGFMTMPASQDLSPHSCASAMAPRSQSCHAVGAGDPGLESEDYSDTQSQHGARCPPVKPKRHPSTRLSASGSASSSSCGASDPRGPPNAPPPPPPGGHTQGKHSEKKNGMKKSDSGELGGKKVPPLKPKRSPSTQLTFETPPPRAPSAAGSSYQGADGQQRGGDSEDEPVYIEMVGKVFPRESQASTPHPAAPAATTPDSDSDQSEAIYEEMKYLLQEDRGGRGGGGGAAAGQRRPPTKHDKLKGSKHYRAAAAAAASSSGSPVPRATSASPSCSKAKAAVSASHSSPLPSSASSTPVPQALSSSPHTPRAPTPYLLPGNKSETECGGGGGGGGGTKIPAPFPNLLQHRPPLLAFPQPAAASSGVGVQQKASASAKQGTQSLGTSTQPSSSSSSAGPSAGLAASGSKESSGGGSAQQDKHGRGDAQLGPAPGLRARSHSTPLPPSSKSTSPFSHHHHHHHHPHHRPSHYHHYRKPERGDSPAMVKSSSQGSGQGSTQSQMGGQGSGKEGKSGSGGSSTPTPLRPHSRPHLRSHTSHGLPAYKPPSSDSPLLWTYPSVGFRRPPAYESLRGPSSMPPLQQGPGASGGGEGSSKGSGGSGSLPAKAGFMPWDSGSGLAFGDEGYYWPVQRKLSFSHGSRDAEKEEGRAWNGSADALLRTDKEEPGSRRGHSSGNHSHFSSSGARSLGYGDPLGGGESSQGFRALLPRSGHPLPCSDVPRLPQRR